MKKNNNISLLDKLIFAIVALSENGEEWREIQCYEIADKEKTYIIRDELQGKYFISNYGRVLSLCHAKPKILKQQLHNGKYYRVMIDKKPIPIHRAVAEYFIGNIKGKEAHHKNKNAQDNNANNIEILTRAEHIQKHKEMRCANA